ncbi:hypothetical protein BV20DRAFT_102268 [Pilatotrama ljubarskyi]|nr:hypothetical protein BV20DRAFT_102268 [Pilatotrama ljubarskyi]
MPDCAQSDRRKPDRTKARASWFTSFAAFAHPRTVFVRPSLSPTVLQDIMTISQIEQSRASLMWPASTARGGTLLLNAQHNATLAACTTHPAFHRTTVAQHQVAGRGSTDLRTCQVLSDSCCGCRSGLSKNGPQLTCPCSRYARRVSSRGLAGMPAEAQRFLRDGAMQRIGRGKDCSSSRWLSKTSRLSLSS